MSESPTSPAQAPSAAALPPTAPRFLPLLVLLFIGSGCAALVYEVVWLQMLQLIIGSTGVSLGVLLGVFMGGMCLGSWLLPRVVSSKFHPMVVYAVLELGIGVCGLLFLLGMPAIELFYTKVGGVGPSAILMRGVVGAICLLPPTILMGATLPAIARWVETTPQGVSWLGFFYGGNIVGAVSGCLLAGFYLLPAYSMPVATYVAAAINAVVAIIALGLSAQTPHTPPVAPALREPVQRVEGAWAIYVTIGLSGLVALGAEVVWVRLISLLAGATVYTFSIVLAVFLVGLGLGSSVGSLLARSVASPRVALGVCQMLVAVAFAWTSFTITQSLPHWPIDPQINPGAEFVFQLDMARAFWAILPGTLLWGASFPLALAAVAARGQDSGRLVGGVYAANTVGAIFGALLTSLLMIPTFGTQDTQRVLVGLAAVGAIIAFAPLLVPGPASADRPRPSSTAVAADLVLTLAFAGLAMFIVQPPYWGAVAYGRFSATWAKYLIDPEHRKPEQYIEKVYVGEGMNVTVAVSKTTAGVLSFHGAGKVQASTDPQDMRLQRMLGHLSVLAHKDPDSVKKVLVVACGAGVTAGSFIPYKNVEEIVIVDIEPLVPTTVTPRFGASNHWILGGTDADGRPVPKDPRVRVIFDDGRHFIRTTKEKFDVITSDPIDPWVKGCAAMNTIEYYEMCKEHLNPGGVMSLWIPLYESDLATIKSVLGTFFTVFPNGILWSNDYNGEGYDAVLFGTVEPTRLNVDKVEEWLETHPDVKDSLADVGFHSTMDLFGTFAGDAPHLKEWMADAEINTDRNLRLQYLAGKAFNNFIGREILSDILKGFQYPNPVFSGSEDKLSRLEDALRHQGRLSSVAAPPRSVGTPSAALGDPPENPPAALNPPGSPRRPGPPPPVNP